MRTDLFTKTCLLAIVFLLGVLALRTGTVHAAPRYQYAVEVVKDYYSTRPENARRMLEKYSTEGWELVAAPSWPGDSYEASGHAYLIFRKAQ